MDLLDVNLVRHLLDVNLVNHNFECIFFVMVVGA